MERFSTPSSSCLLVFLQTEDYLKRKIRSRPEKSELIRMHILEGKHYTEPHTSGTLVSLTKKDPLDPWTLVKNCHAGLCVYAEPFLQVKQLQLKKACLAVDLNDKIAQRPGPMELIHKNILPVHSSIKQAFIGKWELFLCNSFSMNKQDSTCPLHHVSTISPNCLLGCCHLQLDHHKPLSGLLLLSGGNY